MKTLNKPYVKKYDKNGILLNPIEKGKPYISGVSQRPFKRGHRKIEISEFIKYRFGNPLVTLFRKNRKGKWIKAQKLKPLN